MNIITTLFGEGQHLNALQMGDRAFIVFVIAYILIRVSGRRSFGQCTPLDNIISILLGAILSRAVTGASPFIPVICACFIFVIIHRILGWLTFHNTFIDKLIEGKKIILFENGNFIGDNLEKALLSKEDVLQGVRLSALTDNLNKIEKIYMERNGEISLVKKDD